MRHFRQVVRCLGETQAGCVRDYFVFPVSRYVISFLCLLSASISIPNCILAVPGTRVGDNILLDFHIFNGHSMFSIVVE